MEYTWKKSVPFIAAVFLLASILSTNISALMLNPSFQKLTYDTKTYANMLASTPYYTDIGVITDGTTTKNCRGLQMRDAPGGYVSANGWVTGLGGTHAEVYIYGQASNGSIDSSATIKCNMLSDCSTVFTTSGTISTATSVFYINDICRSGVSGHSINSAYTSWGDRISF